jgi:RimJ/RimL family protein N-acetyltransferase
MDPQPVTLVGPQVRLEPLTAAHAPGLVAALTPDLSIWQWLPVEPPVTVPAMEDLIAGALAAQAAGTQIPFATIALPSGAVAGSTRYLNISRHDHGLEIGWTWLGTPWQRTAINTEAKYLLLRHAFEALGAARVQLKTDLRNLQSQTAIARLGAVREGVLRKYQMVRDDFIRDTVMFSIIDSEWPGVKAGLEAKMAAYAAPGAERP